MKERIIRQIELQTWFGRWHGRFSTRLAGRIGELQNLIPTFTASDFKIGTGINEYLNLITREPLISAITLGDEVNPTDEQRALRDNFLQLAIDNQVKLLEAKASKPPRKLNSFEKELLEVLKPDKKESVIDSESLKRIERDKFLELTIENQIKLLETKTDLSSFEKELLEALKPDEQESAVDSESFMKRRTEKRALRDKFLELAIDNQITLLEAKTDRDDVENEVLEALKSFPLLTTTNLPIPLAAVSNGYGRYKWYGSPSPGYKLVQHCDMLSGILRGLESFDNGGQEHVSFHDSRFESKVLRDAAALDAKMQISQYGARVWIEILVPNYKFYLNEQVRKILFGMTRPVSNAQLDFDDLLSDMDEIPHTQNEEPYTLKVICLNSVDGSTALRLGLSLYRDRGDFHDEISMTGSQRLKEAFRRRDFDEIFIAGLHRNHDSQLADDAIQIFFENQFRLFSNGDWLKQTVLVKVVRQLFPDLDIQRIQQIIAESIRKLDGAESYLHPKSGEMNYFLFRAALVALQREKQSLGSYEEEIERVFGMLGDLEEDLMAGLKNKG